MEELKREIRLPFLWISIAWGLLIATASFLPGGDKQALHFQGQLHLWLHMFAFLVLGLLFSGSVRPWICRGVLLCFAVLIAGSTELGEHLVFHTNFEYLDLGVDLCGIIGAFVVSLAYRPIGGLRRTWLLDSALSRSTRARRPERRHDGRISTASRLP